MSTISRDPEGIEKLNIRYPSTVVLARFLGRTYGAAVAQYVSNFHGDTRSAIIALKYNMAKDTWGQMDTLRLTEEGLESMQAALAWVKEHKWGAPTDTGEYIVNPETCLSGYEQDIKEKLYKARLHFDSVQIIKPEESELGGFEARLKTCNIFASLEFDYSGARGTRLHLKHGDVLLSTGVFPDTWAAICTIREVLGKRLADAEGRGKQLREIIGDME